MAIFSEKVISAKFIDPPNNLLIEVLYREGDVAIPYVLEVDFTQQDFNDLLKEISLDEIQSVTKKERELQSKAFNNIIEAEITRRWQLESEKVEKMWATESEKIKEVYSKADEYYSKASEVYSKADEYYSKASEVYSKADEYYSNKINEISLIWEEESKKIKEAYQDADQYVNIKNSEISLIWEEESKKIKEAYQDADRYVNIKSGEISQLWDEESKKIKEAYTNVDKYADNKSGEISQLWDEESKKIKEAYQDVDQYAGTMKSDLAKEYRDQFMSSTKFSIDNLPGKDIFNHILKKNDNKDFVFDLKVGILEDPDIAKSKDKNLKLAIRKAKSVFELIKLYEEAKGIS